MTCNGNVLPVCCLGWGLFLLISRFSPLFSALFYLPSPSFLFSLVSLPPPPPTSALFHTSPSPSPPPSLPFSLPSSLPPLSDYSRRHSSSGGYYRGGHREYDRRGSEDMGRRATYNYDRRASDYGRFVTLCVKCDGVNCDEYVSWYSVLNPVNVKCTN